MERQVDDEDHLELLYNYYGKEVFVVVVAIAVPITSNVYLLLPSR